MNIEFSGDDCQGLWVNRETVTEEEKRAFYVFIGQATVLFEDEKDAEKLAKAICDELGLEIKGRSSERDEQIKAIAEKCWKLGGILVRGNN